MLPVFKLAELILPVTPNDNRVPTLVIYGCALVSTVPVTSVNTAVLPLTLPVVTLPVTARSDKVPTLLMKGCALVFTVPVTALNCPSPDAITQLTELMLPVMSRSTRVPS